MPAPAPVLRDVSRPAHAPSPTLARVLRRVPESVRGDFSPEQLEALDAALASDTRGRFPVNIRLTVIGRVFLVVLAGLERRHPERRREERRRHPLHTLANILFLIGIAVAGLTLGSVLQWLILGG